MSQDNQSKGFVLVATWARPYYEAAILLAQSIRDYWPEARMTFFTHEEWLQDKHRKYFEHIITPVPPHIRTKLWAIQRSPYDITCYVDVDMYCQHTDVKYVFDQLPDGVDIAMSENRAYNSKVVYFTEDNMEGDGIPGRELRHWKEPDKTMIEEGNCHRFRWHCGFFVYRNTEKVRKLFEQWQHMTVLHQMTGDTSPYPRSMKFWDTFSFWRVCHESDDLPVIDRLPDDARWNFVAGYRDDEVESLDDIIFHHYTVPQGRVNKERIRGNDIPSKYGTFDVLK